jgi:guanine deaminase
MEEELKKFMQEAIRVAREGMHAGSGGPFGCVIVKEGKIIASGCNCVVSTKDPTAHAEIVAIRKACNILDSFQLTGCDIYTSCEPCPMCLGAIYWARPKAIYFACTKEDAAAAGFDDSFIYGELLNPIANRKIPMNNLERKNALYLFEEWTKMNNKVRY